MISVFSVGHGVYSDICSGHFHSICLAVICQPQRRPLFCFSNLLSAAISASSFFIFSMERDRLCSMTRFSLKYFTYSTIRDQYPTPEIFRRKATLWIFKGPIPRFLNMHFQTPVIASDSWNVLLLPPSWGLQCLSRPNNRRTSHELYNIVLVRNDLVLLNRRRRTSVESQ